MPHEARHDIIRRPLERASALKILIIVFLVAIIATLGSGLYFMVGDQGESRRLVRSLTLRVGLSFSLFALLYIAWMAGLIQPHGLG